MVNKKPPVYKDPRAVELCNEIRRLYFTKKDSGWIARPNHGEKKIFIGHPDYDTDDVISCELYSLSVAIDRLGLADAIGYELEIVKK
jgi:hypothetical protein